jgi:hypothetical protein
MSVDIYAECVFFADEIDFITIVCYVNDHVAVLVLAYLLIHDDAKSIIFERFDERVSTFSRIVKRFSIKRRVVTITEHRSSTITFHFVATFPVASITNT